MTFKFKVVYKMPLFILKLKLQKEGLLNVSLDIV